jgi:hypothetical protein
VTANRPWRALVIVVVLVVLGASGCGRADDRSAVRTVTERFVAAVESGDGVRACAQLSPDTRAELESQEQHPCREAIGSLQLEGGSVTGVQVYVLNAIVELSSGEAAFLDHGTRGWRVSAVGCEVQGATPADRPYDCELED